jgi:hypothetical protein
MLELSSPDADGRTPISSFVSILAAIALQNSMPIAIRCDCNCTNLSGTSLLLEIQSIIAILINLDNLVELYS